ncbi:MAG: hypothetical protein E6I62_09195, partial [Chloroflexi bacterium]
MSISARHAARLIVATPLVASLALLAGPARPEPARAALITVPVPDVLTMRHDRTAVVPAPGVLGNDIGLLGGTTAILTSPPTHGSVTLQSNGGYTYVPNASYVGTDVFHYRPSGLLTPSTTVTITITNAAPVSLPDSYQATAGVALHVAAPGVMSNDSDADGDGLTASLVTSASHGSLSLSTNGAFTYTANGGYSGADAFTYRAGDGLSWSAVATVALQVSQPAPSPSPSPTPT